MFIEIYLQNLFQIPVICQFYPFISSKNTFFLKLYS